MAHLLKASVLELHQKLVAIFEDAKELVENIKVMLSSQ